MSATCHPFTELFKQTLTALGLRTTAQQATTIEASSTYVLYFKKGNWVPPIEWIEDIWHKLSRYQQEYAKGSPIVSLDQFKEAAKEQEKLDPISKIRPDARNKNAKEQTGKPIENKTGAIVGRMIDAEVIIHAVAEQRTISDQLTSSFATTKTAKILVIRGIAILSLRDALLQQLIRKKNKDFHLQVLMLNPGSDFARQRAKEINETLREMSEGILFSIRRLKDISEACKGKIEIRVYDELPTWRIIITDHCTFLSSYLNGIDGNRTPMLVLPRKSGTFGEATDRYFDQLWVRSKDALALLLEKTTGRLSYDDALRLLARHCDSRLVFHCKRVAHIARAYALGAQGKGEKVDVELVEIGALLHDIGKGLSRKLDHGHIGADLIRKDKEFDLEPGYRETLAKIVERHTGVGLTQEDIKRENRKQRLKIPVRDYIPQTIEEKLVAYADKFVVDDNVRTLAENLENKRQKWGADSNFVRTLEEWANLFGEPVH